MRHVNVNRESGLLTARPSHYLALYAKALPLLGIFELFNCRFAFGRLIFTWNLVSWYLLLCYLAFPGVRVALGNLLRQRAVSHHAPATHEAFGPKAAIYAAGLPLLPFRDYAGSEQRLVPGLLGAVVTYLLAPVFLVLVPVGRYFWHMPKASAR